MNSSRLMSKSPYVENNCCISSYGIEVQRFIVFCLRVYGPQTLCLVHMAAMRTESRRYFVEKRGLSGFARASSRYAIDQGGFFVRSI
jgi:hypothetical protein